MEGDTITKMGGGGWVGWVGGGGGGALTVWSQPSRAHDVQAVPLSLIYFPNKTSVTGATERVQNSSFQLGLHHVRPQQIGLYFFDFLLDPRPRPCIT